MAAKYDDSKVDIRALKLNIARGNITPKEYEAFLKSLPDLSKQLEELPAYEEPEGQDEDTSGNLTFSAG